MPNHGPRSTRRLLFGKIWFGSSRELHLAAKKPRLKYVSWLNFGSVAPALVPEFSVKSIWAGLPNLANRWDRVACRGSTSREFLVEAVSKDNVADCVDSQNP